MRTAAAQPWSTSPMTWAGSIRAPSKNTSLNVAPPVMSRSGRTDTPGWRMSITNIVMPSCLGTSGLVRAMTAPRSAFCATDVQTFWPFTTQPSPSRMARVCRLATSEPAPGSEKSWHHTSSPRSRGRM